MNQNKNKRSGFVALVGRPNSGKSSLMNHLLGTSLSIVTPKAQTTRERVLGILNEPERGQMILTDTPGIHRAKEGGLNAFMMDEVREALIDPNLSWYLVDPTSKIEVEEPVLELLKKTRRPVFLIFNKIDLENKYYSSEQLRLFEKQILNQSQKLGIDVAQVFRISALKGSGIPALIEASWDTLPEGPLYYPDDSSLSDRPVRFFVAEKIREQLYLQLGDELPYSCAVEIVLFKEPESLTPSQSQSSLTRIEATIHVERDSQKGMVIGQRGKKIRSIGEAARKQIEILLENKIFLGLNVKVLKNWSRNPQALKRMGYFLP